MTAKTYETASAALAACAHHAGATDDLFQYEVRASFDQQRKVIGYQARVLDLDGFFIGPINA